MNTLYIRWDTIAIADADRHGLYSWHMQQQRDRLILALASDGELDLIL